MAKGRPDRPPDVRCEFQHNTDAPRVARKALAPLLTDEHDPIREAVTVSVSELVTNVIRHTHSGGELRAWDPKPDVPLRLEVEDTDASVPVRKDPEDDEPTGRGLRLVDGAASEWGVDPTPSGKIVWAEFDRTQGR